MPIIPASSGKDEVLRLSPPFNQCFEFRNGNNKMWNNKDILFLGFRTAQEKKDLYKITLLSIRLSVCMSVSQESLSLERLKMSS